MQLILSVWGAGLSTILATVNLYSVYKSRTRFSTSYYFDGLAGNADKIVIYNIGKVDIIINDYKLFFSSRRFFAKKEYLPDYSEPDIISIQVKANDKCILIFNEPDGINLKKIGNRNLYLELRIVGKRTGTILKIC